jgi:uroporphyrinogen decarboxylase
MIRMAPRESVTDRYYRVFSHLPVDRVPDIEFGYWPQTVRRWKREGMALDMTTREENSMFCPKFDLFFGFEPEGHTIDAPAHMNPCFTEEIVERQESSVVMRDGSGVLAQRYMADADESSIPRYIRFPVETPGDWAKMKERYRLDDPGRVIGDDAIKAARAAVSAGKAITYNACGFYGAFRNWMGMENLSYAFYEYPEMIHDMATHWAELLAQAIDRLPQDVPIDNVHWWEDMACRNGPLVSPAIFREFIQAGYRRVMESVRKHGCMLAIVDCDGNPHALVRNWLDEGVNIMFPLEVAAGVDPYAWRREFGKELRLRGGIGKAPLVIGGDAIDRELDRIRPLLDQGGFIPHLDHLVSPDIPYAHYCAYVEKKRKMIGK